jgi:hypothetical protein
MRHMALLNTQHRVLVIASFISTCVLTGCESESWFERFYKPVTVGPA